MRSKLEDGKWYDWYSICSRHRTYDESCNCCTAGQWKSRRALWWSGLFYRLCPWGWRLWVNRKNSPDRKFLEDTFPNLRRKS